MDRAGDTGVIGSDEGFDFGKSIKALGAGFEEVWEEFSGFVLNCVFDGSDILTRGNHTIDFREKTFVVGPVVMK